MGSLVAGRPRRGSPALAQTPAPLTGRADDGYLAAVHRDGTGSAFVIH